MYNELIAMIVLIAVIVMQMWVIVLLRRDNLKIQADLLNRIMSNNYQTYVQAEIAKTEAARPPTLEEIEQAQYERGIPV